MPRINFLDWLSIVLVIIGGLNWGLVGLFGFDLVAYIFGQFTTVTRVIYTLVGLGAIYMIATSVKVGQASSSRREYQAA